MDDKKQQDVSNGDDPFKPQLHIQPGTKIIQPSAALLEELKNQKAEPEPKSQPTKPQETSPLNAAQVTSQKPTPPQSIYPEATKGVDVSAQITHPADTQDKSHDKVLISPKRIFAIRLVTGILLFLELLSLSLQYSLVHALHVRVNIIDTLVTLFMMALLVGILFLKEAARSIFVFVAIASLIIALFGLLTLYVATHKSNVSDATSQQLSRQEIDNSISETNRNNQYTQEQKDLIIKNLKNQPGYSTLNDTKLKVKRYGSYALTLMVAVGPIVFYTRPKIKEAFS